MVASVLDFSQDSPFHYYKNGYQFSPTDIDECANHMCSNGGSCVDGVNNYSCKCKPGFSGDRCQTGAFFRVFFIDYLYFFIASAPSSIVFFFFVLFFSQGILN